MQLAETKSTLPSLRVSGDGASVMKPESCGVLDTPLEPVIGLAEGEIRWRCMTAFARSAVARQSRRHHSPMCKCTSGMRRLAKAPGWRTELPFERPVCLLPPPSPACGSVHPGLIRSNYDDRKPAPSTLVNGPKTHENWPPADGRNRLAF